MVLFHDLEALLFGVALSRSGLLYNTKLLSHCTASYVYLKIAIGVYYSVCDFSQTMYILYTHNLMGVEVLR
jgi:hypothetical protein